MTPPGLRAPARGQRAGGTVELYLSAAYRKPGIRSRRELPAALPRR
jgi:hypothetical protein